MKRTVTFLILTVIFAIGLFATKHSSQSSTAIINATVIDATGGPPITETTVVISGEYIARIGRNSEISVPSNSEVIDASGMFLIPGLWDMHVHVLKQAQADAVLAQFLANGITGVRDMGSPLGDMERIRPSRSGVMGGILRPHIIASGPMLDGPLPMFPDMSIAVGDVAAAMTAVAFLRESRVDFIKVYSLLPRDAYFAIAEEADRLAIPFVGHVPDSVAAAEASEAGQKSIEHLSGILMSCSAMEEELRSAMLEARMNGDAASVAQALKLIQAKGAGTYDESKANFLFNRFAQNGTWQVPTLVAGGTTTKSPFDKPGSEGPLEIVRAMHSAGVGLMAGTDSPNLWARPGISLHQELQLFVAAGLTPMEALQSATRNPAEYLRLLDSLGTVEPGKVADLVLLEANPLEDIGNTKRIAAVVLRGKVLLKSQLKERLSDLSGSH